MKYKLLFLAVLISSFSWGQTSIAAINTNYTQDFNTLSTTLYPTTSPWSDNTTLPGWYARTTGGTGTTITSYSGNTGGTTTAGGFYSFGVAGANAVTDRALGYINSNGFTGTTGTAKGYYGWRLKNNTGVPITSVTVTWTGEQWKKTNILTTQNIILQYQTGATVSDLITGSWTAAPSVFTSPKADNILTVLDGNDPTNRTANISVTITVTIAAGNEIMLRWEDLNDSGNDHYMAIDDVTVKGNNPNKTSVASGDWNTAATWNPVGVPVAADNVVIQAGHVVSTSIAITGASARTGTTTVDGTFQLNNGGWVSGTAFNYNATTGGLNFNDTATYNVNNTDTYWPTTLPPFNVSVLQGGMQMNSMSRTVAGTFLAAGIVTLSASTLTLTGTCQVNTGASFTNTPVFGNASTLVYNNTLPGVGNEWTGNGTTAGSGIPQNVTIQNSATVSMPNSNRGMAGNLNITSGNLTLNATSGDLYVAGNWTRASTATFTPSNRSVYFNAPTSVNQTVTVSASGTETFNYLRVLGIGTLRLATGTNVVVNASSGLTLGSTNATSTIDLNGQNLTISGGGNLDLSAGAKKITSTLAGGKVIITTADLTVTNGGSLITDTNTLIDLQRGLDCGTASLVTINGTLQMNANGFCTGNSPRYGNASLLQYNNGTSYNRQLEWTSTTAATGGIGAPNNVQVSNNTTFNYYNASNNGAKSIVGNLVVDGGATFSMGSISTAGALTIPGNVTVAGILSLCNSSPTVGDDLRTAGNLSFTGVGSLVGNERAIFFTKTGTQTVSSVAALTIPFVGTAGTGTTVQLLSSITISSTPTGVNVLTFGNAADVIDLNGQTLTLGSTGNPGVISGTGTFSGSTTSNLTLLGTGNIGTVKFAANFNLGTFVMNRTSTGGCVMGSNLTINANSSTALTLTAGIIDLGGSTMTMAATVPALISGSSTSYVIADKSNTGAFSIGVSATAQTYKFPIGDRAASNNGTEYSPCTINFSAGTFTGAFITVAVEDSKEPNYDATTDFLSRYWEIKRIGTVTGPTYTFVGTFINSELNGTNNIYRGNQWNGTAWLDNGVAIPAAATTFTITGTTTLPATNTNFTAGRRDPEINIRQGATNYLTGLTYNFGTINIGSSSGAITFTVFNIGQQTLTLGAATMSGSANYTATAFGSTSVTGPSGTTTFTVTFTPTVSGTITGSISIVNNDTSGSENPYVINFTGVGNCPTTTIAATPTSGPAGTEVLINASVGTFTGTTSVNFNGVLATYVLNTATQMLVTVPDGAVSGGINIVNGTTNCVTTTAFTAISKTGTCTGMNELIMTEIYDKTAGALAYIEVYNGTGAAINLTNYFIRRFGDTAAMQANNYQDYGFNGVPALTTIANGAVKYGKISNDIDTATPDFKYTVSAGINASDIFYLYNGTTIVDVFFVPTASPGYTEKRNLTTAGPNTSSNPSDWTEIVSPSESVTDLGLFPYTPPVNNVPAISADPVDLNTCNLTASFSVTATAPVGSLTYQWQYNSGLTAGWAPISGATFAGVTATGFTSSTLNLNGAIGTLNGYQFYCQVIQSGGCIMASDAAQLTVSTATWNGTVWTNGPPSLTKQVILTGSYNMAAPLPSFEACSLYVNSPNVLTITSGNYVAVQNNITVISTGNVIVEDDGSLVQIDDNGVNTGSVTVRRITSAKLNDYVYFSSPVANFPVTSISPATSTNLIWKWNPTLANSNNGQGSWVHPTFTPTPDNMAVGVGYIIKGLTGTNDASFTNYLATFVGTPFNGIKQPSISRGDITTSAGAFPAAPYAGTNGATITQFGDNMNLIGNPYPSSISAIKFLTLNTNIDGNIRLWTHGTAASISTSPYYGTYGYNYSPGDYITYNVSGTSTGPSVFSGFVASGQGFFVTMNDGATSTQTVTFNNAMRRNGSTYYDNSNFYRTTSSHNTVVPIDIERHRIWLDLVNTTGTATRTLMGYIDGATMEKDRLFDASTSVGNFQNLYSLIDNKPYGIQGRALPFDSEDKVPLGLNLTASGTYTIAIGVTDGLFHETNQDIYLEDKVLNIIHDLRQAPYAFTSESGRFDTRFILRYNTTALGTNDFETLNNSVVVATPNQNQIAIKSAIENMKAVVVYDMLGRVVYNNNQVNSNELTILKGVLSQQGLIVKITLESGLVVTKKIIL